MVGVCGGLAGNMLAEPVALPFGTRVSEKRILPVIAPERRFWAMLPAPPPLPFFLSHRAL